MATTALSHDGATLNWNTETPAMMITYSIPRSLFLKAVEVSEPESI